MVTGKFLVLVLQGAFLFDLGNALNCTSCLSAVSWEDCQKAGGVRSCTLEDVNGFHGVLHDGNPNLNQGGPEDEFQCFALHLRMSHPGRKGFSSFAMGCTFKKTQFCQGWPSGMASVAECRTFNG
uniref:(northern house mosquito) hypothetical protein n=1 Tax=Culex pipiens TaxID=7175 RepID=A0A8D8DB98_CULPI